ncbi:MAG: hypothetical protein JSS81_28830 [Acidobacteria bacterium]|nr:hypothetical protein [Acidobacteriota bacterium]
MKYLKPVISLILTIAAVAVAASAQSEDYLKRYFEGRRVEIRLDMPATKDGVNVYPERDRGVDYNRYGDLLKEYGVSLREGDSVTITKIKVKDKHIEFQLNGGGYGTFGDESVPSSYVSSTPKSRRERWLEESLERETDQRRRREIREELGYLRRERERNDDYRRAEAAQTAEIAKIRIAEKRLQGGSRFNIKFDRKLTEQDLTPQAVMDALADYIYFDNLP